MSVEEGGMKKKVVAHEYTGACRYTGYIDRSILLTLDCGHQQVRKASAGIPKTAKCRDCSMQSRRKP